MPANVRCLRPEQHPDPGASGRGDLSRAEGGPQGLGRRPAREFNQLGQARVGDAVVDRPAAALALDEPCPSQDAERVGNGVLAGVDRERDVPDAELPASAQCRDDTGAHRISEHAEELGEIARLVRRDQLPPSRRHPLRIEGVVMRSAASHTSMMPPVTNHRYIRTVIHMSG